ncbi:hypothetical protein ABZP36_010531 [Zizania latifolia]
MAPLLPRRRRRLLRSWARHSLHQIRCIERHNRDPVEAESPSHATGGGHSPRPLPPLPPPPPLLPLPDPSGGCCSLPTSFLCGVISRIVARRNPSCLLGDRVYEVRRGGRGLWGLGQEVGGERDGERWRRRLAERGQAEGGGGLAGGRRRRPPLVPTPRTQPLLSGCAPWWPVDWGMELAARGGNTE